MDHATATITDGRRLRGEQSRASVLQCAARVASTEGLSGLTIGRLAVDLGISKGNITVLFGSKEALQIATLDAAVDVFVDTVVTPALKKGSSLERLRGLCDGWFSYVDRRTFPGGCLLYSTSSEFRARPGVIQERIKFHRKHWQNLLSHWASQAQLDGLLAPNVDIERLVFELTAYHAAANVAALIGDRKTFAIARKSTRERIEAGQVDLQVYRKRKRMR